jgi:glycosyltransferase involved in cell wall biosynthesis
MVSMFYKNVSIISDSLRDFLKLNKETIKIIPLGGEKLPTISKSFEMIKLLYVGSLDNRNIHETILGLSHFLKLNNSNIDATYDIVGFGKQETLKQLENTIKISGLIEKVILHGRKKIDELGHFYEDCNIGVVYVPQTKAYDCQPSTKLFECLLAGMPVIATNTLENRITLKADCGVITEDNPRSFANALKEIIQNRNIYSSASIKECYSEYEWKNIVKNRLEPYFMSLLEK